MTPTPEQLQAALDALVQLRTNVSNFGHTNYNWPEFAVITKALGGQDE